MFTPKYLKCYEQKSVTMLFFFLSSFGTKNLERKIIPDQGQHMLRLQCPLFLHSSLLPTINLRNHQRFPCGEWTLQEVLVLSVSIVAIRLSCRHKWHYSIAVKAVNLHHRGRPFSQAHDQCCVWFNIRKPQSYVVVTLWVDVPSGWGFLTVNQT